METFYLKRLLLIVPILSVFSCADLDPLEYQVEKPLSIEQQEELDQLEPLKEYIGESSLKLGAGVSISSYNSQGTVFSLSNSNFQELTSGYGMKHGAVVNDNGELNLDEVSQFVNHAKEAGLSIYGHTLAWHSNQNATFLNSTIAPTILPAQSNPEWETILSIDFESDDQSGYQSNGPNAALAFTSDGAGFNGEGRALTITNAEVRPNEWDSQLFVTFPEATEVGQVFRLEMDIKSDVDTSINTQAHTAPGSYKHYDFFGTLTANPTWKHISIDVTINENTSGCNTIAFNLGTTAATYQFDNIEVSKYNENGNGPDWEDLLDQPFETDAQNGYQSNGPNAVLSFTAMGEGAEDSGRALEITNAEVRPNEWESQLFVTFPKVTEVGQKFKLEMDVRADAVASINTQAQTAPGAYKHYNFFGTINATTQWKHINTEITINESTAGCNTIAFNLGLTATTYYFDNLKVSWFNEEAGQDIIIEMSEEEKKDTLSFHLDKWISGIMEVSKSNTFAWDVVNEPMDDGNPYELKSGIGKSEIAADEFYWQDYLGKDYAVEAFKLAAKYGNADDILFINDYNLEYNIDKCKGIIAYVNYIEEQGARVDGIGTQMHINIDSDRSKIIEMFKLLAATGKQIKISELDIGIGVQTKDATEELYLAQADMYHFVISEYFKLIPQNQQYGITIWSPTDSPSNSSWRAGEPIGLWTESFTRKIAYKGVVEALQSKETN